MDFKRLIEVWMETNRLESVGFCPCLHRSMLKKIILKMIVLEREMFELLEKLDINHSQFLRFLNENPPKINSANGYIRMKNRRIRN